MKLSAGRSILAALFVYRNLVHSVAAASNSLGSLDTRHFQKIKPNSTSIDSSSSIIERRIVSIARAPSPLFPPDTTSLTPKLSFLRKFKSYFHRKRMPIDNHKPLPTTNATPTFFHKTIQSLHSLPTTMILKLCFYYFLLYFFTILYNLSNKHLLSILPLPASITAIQTFLGIPCFLPFWLFLQPPSFSILHQCLYNPVLPWIAAAHCLGNFATVLALQGATISFVHVLKSTEPLFTVLLSVLLYRQSIRLSVLFSLLPIILGVSLASMQEMTFSWYGVFMTTFSNLAYQYRMLLSKTAFQGTGGAGGRGGERISAANLFRLITLYATPLTFFLAWTLEGTTILTYLNLLPAAAAAALPPVLSPGQCREVYYHLLLSGMSFYWYNEIAFWILDLVHPLSHAVGNSLKRIVLIVCSVVVLQTPVTWMGWMGTLLAIGGSFLYAILSSSSSSSSTAPTIPTPAIPSTTSNSMISSALSNPNPNPIVSGTASYSGNGSGNGSGSGSGSGSDGMVGENSNGTILVHRHHITNNNTIITNNIISNTSISNSNSNSTCTGTALLPPPTSTTAHDTAAEHILSLSSPTTLAPSTTTTTTTTPPNPTPTPYPTPTPSPLFPHVIPIPLSYSHSSPLDQDRIQYQQDEDILY